MCCHSGRGWPVDSSETSPVSNPHIFDKHVNSNIV